MKKVFLWLLCTVFLVGCGKSSETSAYQRVTSKEAMEMMKRETAFQIVDVRTKAEYQSGHIPNAINLPNESIGTKEIEELPDKEALILVYCRSGQRSRQASEKLVELGYKNIVDFGGIQSWEGEVVVDEKKEEE